MLKKINLLLKLVGLNLVRAKRKAPKSEAKRVKEFIEEFVGPRPPHTPEELKTAPLRCFVNQPGTVPLSDYVGDAEWADTPNPGKTHFVGDDCPGGHRLTACEIKASQPSSDNTVTGPTS